MGIIVNIEYKPIVVLEEVFVHTKAGNKVEIVCKVIGHPHPTVEWRKDGIVIKKNEARVHLNHYGKQHSLSIESVQKEDYGSYACRATNYLGFVEATQQISGKASPAQFKSSPNGTEDSSYLLEWTSMSCLDRMVERVARGVEDVREGSQMSYNQSDGPLRISRRSTMSDRTDSTQLPEAELDRMSQMTLV